MDRPELLRPPMPRAREHFAWATVVSAAPLAVQIDGHPEPLAVTPLSLVADLEPDDRVLVQFVKGGLVVVGRLGGLVAASSIVGELDAANIPDLPASKIPNLPASKITSGTLSLERLPMVQGRVQVPAGGTQIGVLYYSANVAITLPAGVFSSAPRVRVTSSGLGVHFACVQGTPTSAGFTAVLTRLDAYPDGNQYFEWEAWQA